jgi:hypothetical protein
MSFVTADWRIFLRYHSRGKTNGLGKLNCSAKNRPLTYTLNFGSVPLKHTKEPHTALTRIFKTKTQKSDTVE